MSKHFTHLHLHTEYSLLDGAIRLPDLVTMAKKQEWKAVGISDHGNIFGAVKFFQLAKKENVKPILGVEMYFTPDVNVRNVQDKYNHLILIVQNNEGYKNLCKLLAFAHQDGYYFKPRIDYQRLEEYSAGLIVSTACLGGHIPSLLQEGNFTEAEKRTQWFKQVFGPDRFFYELAPGVFQKQVVLNNLLLEYAAKWDVKCIATSDAHYLSPDDREAHEVLLAVQTKDVMTNPNRFSFGDCRCYVRSTQEMLEAFPANEDVIWNTGKIADSCDFAFEFGKLFFPQCPVPPEHTPDSYFRSWCREGLESLKSQKRIEQALFADYDARLELEIDLIIKMGFVGYFLVVGDFIQWAKKQGIPVGPGRGSAAGSLVAWALQITNCDPIKYNLLFERFLNPERVSMPDIDIDFCIEQRETVINYVKDKYGQDCVCQIITFGTMMAKGVLKDVARALGFPFQDANMLTDLIPDQLKITLKEAIEQEPKLQQMIDSNPEVKKLFDISFKLEGLTRHASKHAAGVVISPTPLAETLPLYIPAKTTDLVAQYAMTELESIGYLKMDFLGLKNLTVIDRALKAINRNYGVEINLDLLELDDPKVFELLSEGKSNAIFQFESDGLKEVLRKLKPSKFEDLIAVNALYRPGPLGAGMVDDFIERRHGRQKVTYMFPELEPVLSETYGVIVYQEQVMKIASVIAGYSLGASDLLRRAMGKKKAEEMAKQKSLFVSGANTLGFNTKKAAEVFDLMAYFAGYGFNKSHSTAYALIAYHTAYLKANYPREFMAACVTFETGNPDQMTLYLQEISDMHLKLELPDINRSEMEFTATQDGIIFGLQGIKNVGTTAINSIIEERQKRPYTDLLDFCKRVDLRVVNKRIIENLVYAAAMDSIPGNRAQKLAELDKVLALAHEYREQQKTGQMGLFGAPAAADGSNPSSPSFTFQPLEDWSIKEKLEKEKEVAGFYLSTHPLKSYPAISWIQSETFAQGLEKGKTVTTMQEPFITAVGLMQNYKTIKTKKGDAMAFAQFEDLSGSAEIIIFPKTYVEVESILPLYNIFVIRGTVDVTSTAKCKIKANQLIPIEKIFDDPGLIKQLQLTVSAASTGEQLANLKKKLAPGNIQLVFNFSEAGNDYQLISNQKVNCGANMLTEAEQGGVGIKLRI
jgi:DNA polymerase-3 subunit alpha